MTSASTNAAPRPMTFGIDLHYLIDPALFRRAVTHPVLTGRRPVSNIAAAVGAGVMIVALNRVAFLGRALLPLVSGVALGAALVLLVWWKQHWSLVRLHARSNDEGGEMRFAAGPDGILVARPGIESRLAWSQVRRCYSIGDAVLIELATTARLIVPVAVLPDRDADGFIAMLETWRSA